ncbi:MAG: hypothetical protein P8186_22275 [Anaerolineae bacterium]
MVDYPELMRLLSVPRPNGSAAERETARALRAWLDGHDVRYRIETFRLYPYFNEGVGLWIIASRTLLALSIVLRWGWPAALIAAVSLLGGVLDLAFHIPFTTWPGARRAENILIEFEPAAPEQEMVLSAHYDSKTELLDHTRTAFFTRKINLGIGLTALLGALGPLDAWLLGQGSPLAAITFWAGVGLGLALLVLAWGFGLNLTMGLCVEPIHAAVYKWSDSAILLDLEYLVARSDEWPLPAVVVNLELMAQDGDYVIWEHESNTLRRVPTSHELNQALAEAVADVTGHAPRRIPSLMSDGFSFASAGIPTAVLGTYHSQMEGGGLHRPTDKLARVVPARLAEAVAALVLALERYEAAEWNI